MKARAYIVGRLQGDRLVVVFVSNTEPWNFTIVGPGSTWVQIGLHHEGRTPEEARRNARAELDSVFYRHLKPLLQE